MTPERLAEIETWLREEKAFQKEALEAARDAAKKNLSEEEAERLGIALCKEVQRESQVNINKVKTLISAGANVDARDADGMTALMWASVNGHDDVAELLIRIGANVNLKDNFQWTALMWASGRRYANIVGMLVSNGAELDLQSGDEKKTALMYALEHGSGDIAEILIKKGADVNVRDKHGRASTEIAVEENVKMLIDNAMMAQT